MLVWLLSAKRAGDVAVERRGRIGGG
jgi:hypothetical protein